ncbi:hypothetical protein Acsp04_34760 [Actinomadura sp. NBRC 104425]|uniref:ABC transporter substrate-binding protein n=1 Tax=Actinomadura sp. NBRC 104425 TaxID=3032204 RepID=UPI0024A5C381|nr:ABC transporter substrate-binding protein [Actinomadura sp. NBRC 104425]GLZ13241.1 hypothetical protein Acsp04_34760 [Actinomadura sp. NBRC 104425]
MAAIAPLRPGDPERLGAYRLTGLLGEGGQGSVFLAEDDGGGRVAIKLLHARFSGDAKARARFAAELEVARRVSPFCTARILDADVEGDRPYIVSEYIDGPSLSKVLADQGPRSGGDLDRLAIGTMTALAAIHQAGVVHRDFKPANVLLAPDGPRVIDFGIARALDATGTMSSTAVGTPAYMAPEQITGGPIGPQADVWAWGATMVYAASGRAAFGQDSIPAVMHRILNLPPDLGALTEPLRGLVARCLSKDAAARPSSQQVLMQLLTLAGSSPAPAAGADPDAPTAMLNQGAEAAAAGTRLHLPPPDSAHAPGGPQAAPQNAPGAFAPPGLPPGFPQYAPAAPGQQAADTPGGGWTPPVPGAHPSWQRKPLTTTAPAGPGGRPRRRGISVLTAGGAAALAALIVAGSVALAQLNREDRGQGAKEGGQVRVAMTAPQSSSGEIDPAHSAFGTERFLAKQLFTGLTEVKQDGTSRLRMARSITPDDTCRQWKIEIKPGTTFSNGEPVDAEAFARGWARNVSNEITGYLLDNIKGYAAVLGGRSQTLEGVRASGNTLTVELDKGDCEFDKRLSDPVFSPVPTSAGRYDNLSYNTAPIGNGPFKLQSYDKDSEAVLVRNERWAFGKTKLDSVRVRLVSDTSGLMTPFTAGTVDWAAVDTTTGRPAGTDRNLRVRPATSQRLLIPITARGPLRDRRARLAVSYALDRQQIATTAMSGLARPAIGLVSPAIPGFDGRGRCPSCERRNTDEAKRLAQEAGVGPGTEVNLYLRDVGGYRTWTQPVVQQLEQVLGWKVTLRTYSATDYRAFTRAVTAKDAQGLIALGWQPDYPSAYTMLQPLLAGDQIATADNGRLNYAGWKDKTFDADLATYLATRDEASRTRVMQAAEKRALDDMAIIPVTTDLEAAVVSDKFSGLDLDYEGFPTVATAARR